MNTIFHDVITHFLTKALQDAITKSEQQDKSPLSTLSAEIKQHTLGFFPLVRDTALSDQKRTRLGNLIKNINQLAGIEKATQLKIDPTVPTPPEPLSPPIPPIPPTTTKAHKKNASKPDNTTPAAIHSPEEKIPAASPPPTDGELVEKIRQALRACIEDIRTMSHKKNCSGGDAEHLLLALIDFIESVYVKLNNAPILLNIKHDPTSTLDIFRYYAAMSLARDHFEEQVIKIQPNYDLLSETEELIRSHIKWATSDHQPNPTQNKSIEDDNTQRIREHASTIQREIKHIDLRYILRQGGALYKPSGNYLHQYMNQVMTEIAPAFDTEDINCPKIPNASLQNAAVSEAEEINGTKTVNASC